ncbi:MAG: MCE family protein [Ignavibacteria bacterium]|jgi:phospholipid/cholesterol/gamma-HCH transport system substrate-binding protein|nr:MCE family protein [Ignavibacteria bacterium]MCU7499662.1 MCE family protein [Ignavibacteria bacterium]MCU7512897.1 MCE family protein [Ignavibacteria bacterium]MCU7521425.1 MCE family protein [Ignavibacteria bacterium]MCU7526398.1 MCE family protein [Ignavibacteria bacterium]
MKDQRKTEIKVGVTSLLALLLLIWIFGWAKNYRFNQDIKTVNIQFESANGLEKGDIVTVNGVRKGTVQEINISGNSAIVSAELEPDVKLKEDATFGVSMLDLMGGKKVEIKPGTSDKPLDYKQLQHGQFYADVPAVMAMLGSVQGDLVKIIKEVEVTLSSINGVLSDKDFNAQMKSSLANLASISSKLNIMIDENRQNIRQLSSNGAELTKETTTFIRENKDKISSSLNEIQSVMKNTNDLIGKINKLTDETTQKNNNVGKLLYDESLLKDVKASMQQVNELTKTLLQQLNEKGLNVDAHIKLF